MLRERGLHKGTMKSYIVYNALRVEMLFPGFYCYEDGIDGGEGMGRGFGEVGYCGGKLLSSPVGKRKTTKGADRLCSPLE